MAAASSPAVSARACLAAGDVAAAELAAREALQGCRQAKDEAGEGHAQILLAEALLLRGAWQEAIKPAKKALNLLKPQHTSIPAHEVLLRAHLAGGQLEAARAAADAAAGAADGASVALLRAVIFQAEADVEKAWSAIQEAQELCNVEDLPTMAKLHLEASRVLLAMNLLDETLLRAQQAFTGFETLGDVLGEQQALQVLSEVYSLKGTPYLAPNRPQAVQLVKAMARAVETRDAEAFQRASKQLNNLAISNPPISKKEKREIFEDVLRRDQSANEFIKANSATSRAEGSSLGGVIFRGTEKEKFYWGYRAGGIAYGPRFRGIETALGRASGAQGVDDEAHAFAVYRLQDESDDWEKGFRAHPAILDSALQSGSIIGMAQHL